MKIYQQHEGVVVDKSKYKHVMALTLNPQNLNEGLVRCIVSRKGTLRFKGFVDRSILCKLKSIKGLEKYQISEPLIIKNSSRIFRQLGDKNHDFIGFEDPDLVYDQENCLLHLYFTLPFIKKEEKDDNIVTLGHAVGKSLADLEMTDPVLPVFPASRCRAKELSLAPINSQGIRLNLIESRDKINEVSYHPIRIALAKDLSHNWQFGDTVFHPKYDGFPWCAGHVSPGPLLPKEFIDVGKNKRIGVINGREANTFIDQKTKYGRFSIGLFIYDYERGKIDWVSKQPLIFDSEAKITTFASYFVQTTKQEGILYAHVDDSFVRAYTLYADRIRRIIGKI
jgi:hypothetical protein